jgi:hypothetical protein
MDIDSQSEPGTGTPPNGNGAPADGNGAPANGNGAAAGNFPSSAIEEDRRRSVAPDGDDDLMFDGRGPDRRQSLVDRRTGIDRRQRTAEESGYPGPERRKGGDRRDSTGLERRRGPGRRRTDERRVAEEGEMNAEQFEFVMAVEAYKKVNRRLYPTWTEILEVLLQLGYRKVLPREVHLENVPEPELAKVEE